MKKIIILLLIFSGLNAAAQLSEKEFMEPATKFRPMIFWDWMHDMVTKEGITSDLETFKKFGLSGTLVMIIGEADAGFNPRHSIPSTVKPMSEEFFDAWRFAAEESSRLGLTMISQCGPGWCHSGGPWIKPSQATQHIAMSEIIVESQGKIMGIRPEYPGTILSGAKYVLPIPGGADFTADISVLAFRKENTHDISTVINLSDQKGRDKIEYEFPAGTWIVRRYAMKNAHAYNRVAPAEGRGLECDKLDKDAVQAMYEGFVGRFIRQSPGLAGKVIIGMEADSWEVGNPEWTASFTDEFTKRRGYNPEPWMIFLNDDQPASIPEMAERFRNDVYLTMNDLFAENFFTYLHDLMEKNGMQMYTEPYEAPFDPVRAGGRVQVPMGEFWARGDVMHSVRWAASAANTYGRKTVAAEAFTGRWSDEPWKMDPFGLKRIGDLAFCNGLNMNILHGTALQPWGNRVKPGMPMAWWGTMFLPGQTWLETGKAWTDYLSRCQFVLSQGKNVADIIFFMPSLGWRKTIPTGLHKLYNYDVATEELLREGVDWKDGYFILPSGARYRVLILPKTNGTMEPDIISRLTELAQKGGKIICQDRPLRSASLTDFPHRDEEVRRLAELLWGKTDGEKITENRVGKGSIVWMKNIFSLRNDPETEWALRRYPAGAFYNTPAHTTEWSESLVTWLRKNGIKPDLEVNNVSGTAMMWGGMDHTLCGTRSGNDAIAWTHRVVGNDDIWFISNQTADYIQPEITFRVSGRIPELWDPATGRIYKAGKYTYKNGCTKLPLPLSPFGSVFVVFNNAGSATLDYPDYSETGKHILCDGEWTIRFPDGWGAPAEIKSRLRSLTEFPDKGIRFFSGTATWSYEFRLDKKDIKDPGTYFIDLGRVKNIAEVSVNDKMAETLWKPPYCTDIGYLLKEGLNNLTIRVTNTWNNRLIGDEQQPDDCEWGPLQYNCNESAGKQILKIPNWLYDGSTRPSTKRYTFTTWKFYEPYDPLIESGLIGPVRIVKGVPGI